MKRFRYSALTKGGELVSGDRIAADPASVIAWLHDQALLPIDAAELDGQLPTAPAWKGWQDRPLANAELALLSHQLARLLKAGLPLDRTLALLLDLTPARRTQSALRTVLEKVRDGAGLAEAMTTCGRQFPETFMTLVRAGEMSGGLQGVLTETAAFLERSEAMRQRIVSAMVYPTLLIIVATLSVGLILTEVLPQFEPMFREAGARLPATTRLVMTVSDVVRDEWWLIAVIGLGIGGAVRAGRNSVAGAAMLDRVLLGVPVVGHLVVRSEIGRFCRTLGVMIASGVPAPSALALAGTTIGNTVLAATVEEAAGRFREGEGLSAPLARSGRFPKLALQLIRIGEETGRLDNMLSEIANLFDQEVQRTLERLLSALVPGLTVLMGLVVALIVGAVMSALMSVNALAV